MTLQVTAASYHLRYLPDDDRILISVDLDPTSELGMPLTRRLTRNLLAALAKIVGERWTPASAATPAVRDTILDFEHSQSVADAVAGGAMRDEPPEEALEKTQAMPPTLVREVKIVPKPDGLSLVFDNGAQLLTLDVAAERIHMVIETFLQMAERAGWDFPPIASWLDPAKTAIASAAGKTLN